MRIKYVYFIPIIMAYLLASESQASMMCTNQFSILPMRLESFVKSNQTENEVVSSPLCHISAENSTLSEHREQYFTRSEETHLIRNPSQDSAYESLNVFILDFRLVNSNVVYLDFLNYEKILDSQEDIEQATTNGTNPNLIINLVSRQFITFWLMNVPSEPKAKHFQQLTIIISGKAQLRYYSAKSDASFITVLHAPAYEDHKQHCLSNQSHKKKWLTYLRKSFYSTGKTDPKDMPGVIYKQHLHVFYHIYHVEIDLDLIYKKHLNPIKSAEKFDSSHLAVQYLRKDRGLYNLDICLISSETTLWKHCQYEPIRLIYNGKDNVYIVEIEQRSTARQQLRFLVGDCDESKEYHVILFLNSNEKLERIILEHSNCKLNLLSNVPVINMFGKLYPNIQYYESDKDLCPGIETLKQLNSTSRNLYLAKSLEKKLGFQVDMFYHTKVNAEASEIELSFASLNQQSVNAHRFLNHLSLSVFNLHNTTSRSRSNSTESIKLTVASGEIDNYFRLLSLNFTDFYLNYLSYKADNNFFVTKRKCYFNQLLNALDSSINLKTAFLFNMNLYDSDCYYFEQKTHTVFMTVGINVATDNAIFNSYFTLHHSDSHKENDQTNNQHVLNYETLKEDAAKNYFDSVIYQTLSSPYTLESRTLRNESNELVIGFSVKLAALDDSISWQLNSCWLSSLICALEENSEFSFLGNSNSQDQIESTPWVNNVSEVVEYYYEYYYDYIDVSTNESVLVSDTVLNSHTSMRKKRELEYSNKLQISTELSRHDAYSVRRKQNSEEANRYERSLEIIFKIYNFDMSSLETKRYIHCDLKPIVESTPQPESNSTSDENLTKVKKYLRDLNITIGKVIAVADVSSNTVSPLSLVNFKCSRTKTGQQTTRADNSYAWKHAVTYLFIVLNIIGLLVIILMLKYLICKKETVNIIEAVVIEQFPLVDVNEKIPKPEALNELADANEITPVK